MTTKKIICESCSNKPAEYVLDERNLCAECYTNEEKKIRAQEIAVNP